MHYIPVKTRALLPPKDDLFHVLDETNMNLQEGDVLLVTSKVVSIHEGRCIEIGSVDKNEYVRAEAEFIYSYDLSRRPLTVVHNALISSAGIDESNGNGYYTLLPKDPFRSARHIHKHLCETLGINTLGVIITDSHSTPFRYGALSIAIGCHGFEPIASHTGKKDLFGRVMVYSKTNLPDAISGGATLVSGECDEAFPLVIAREVPNLVFTNRDVKDEFFVSYGEDLFSPLFAQFKRKDM